MNRDSYYHEQDIRRRELEPAGDCHWPPLGCEDWEPWTCPRCGKRALYAVEGTCYDCWWDSVKDIEGEIPF